ncbi:MAG: HEAT repeat domain-containing protein [Anaerolineae bacterium]
MSQVEGMTKEEKIKLLRGIDEGEDYFTNYLPIIKEYLNDEDAEVRALAVECLWDYPEPEMIDTLIEMAQHDPSQEVRSKALVVMGRYIYEGEMAAYDFDWGEMEEFMREGELPREDFLRVKEFLLGVIRDEGQSLDSRRFAIEALGYLNEPEVWDIIEDAYQHPDVKMKMSAIFAMGRQANVRWKDIILEELDSPVPELQYEAVRAAGESYLEEATPRLMELALTEGDKDLQLAAIFALGRTGGEGTFEFLDDLTFDDDEEISEVAEVALEEWYIYHSQEELDEFEDWEEWEDEDEFL